MRFYALQYRVIPQFRRFYSREFGPEELKKLIIKRRSIQKHKKKLEIPDSKKLEIPVASVQDYLKAEKKFKPTPKINFSGSLKDKIVAYYDLETTGLSIYQDEIISIGAVTQSGNSFDTYIKPNCDIKWGATQVHGIVKYNNRLFNYKNKFYYSSVEPKEGLSLFQEWLITNEVDILVSHNNLRFDSKMLKNCISRVELSFSTHKPIYFVDSLEIMRRKYSKNYWVIY